MSCHVISCDMMSCHVMSYHVICGLRQYLSSSTVVLKISPSLPACLHSSIHPFIHLFINPSLLNPFFSSFSTLSLPFTRLSVSTSPIVINHCQPTQSIIFNSSSISFTFSPFSTSLPPPLFLLNFLTFPFIT